MTWWLDNNVIVLYCLCYNPKIFLPDFCTPFERAKPPPRRMITPHCSLCWINSHVRIPGDGVLAELVKGFFFGNANTTSTITNAGVAAPIFTLFPLISSLSTRFAHPSIKRGFWKNQRQTKITKQTSMIYSSSFQGPRPLYFSLIMASTVFDVFVLSRILQKLSENICLGINYVYYLNFSLVHT